MWKSVKIGDVAKAVGGNGFPKKYQANTDKPIPFFKVSDMNIDGNEIEMCSANNYVDDVDLGEMKAKCHPTGTIIFPKIGGAISTNKKRILKSIAAFDNNVMGVIPNTSLILPEFLYKIFLSFDLYELSNKAALPSITNGAVEEVEIIVPPLAEQQRIVAKLDAAFAEIDNIATITEKKLKEARKLYASGITEIYFSDKSVPVVPLSTISKIKGGKRLPKGKKLQIEPTSYPYIRVSDFTNFGTIDEKSVQYITEEIRSEISRYTISNEDVYVSIAGTIGKTGIIPQSLDGANLTENAAKIVLDEECDKNYFYFFTTSSSFEKQAIAQTRTAAQPKLALERLGAVELPIHSKLTQQAIAEKARDLRDIVKLVETLLNEKLLKTQALKSAILAQELQSEAA
jgi:type I restriction enzyme S subunit